MNKDGSSLMVDGSILKTIVLIGKAFEKIWKFVKNEIQNSLSDAVNMTFNFWSTERIRNPVTYNNKQDFDAMLYCVPIYVHRI